MPVTPRSRYGYQPRPTAPAEPPEPPRGRGAASDPPGSTTIVTPTMRYHEHKRPSWDAYFLGFAIVAASRADCRRRKVGCVLVKDHRMIAAGYNGAPSGEPGCLSGACPRGLLSYAEVREFTDYDSGPGRCISVHAEANALLQPGIDARGSTAYVTDPPCPTCTKLLAAAGVARVVVLPARYRPMAKVAARFLSRLDLDLAA